MGWRAAAFFSYIFSLLSEAIWKRRDDAMEDYDENSHYWNDWIEKDMVLRNGKHFLFIFSEFSMLNLFNRIKDC